MRDGVSSNNLGDYFLFLKIVAQVCRPNFGRLFSIFGNSRPNSPCVCVLSGDRHYNSLVQLPRSVYVIETKRKSAIGVAVEEEIQRKIDRLGVPRTKSVKTVLVYDGVLAPELEEDGFFDFLVPADRLLGR